MSRPTLADVAHASSVTPGAVSLILRESGRFSEETRKRVKAAAARLQYRPNPILASYKTGKFRGATASHAVPLAWVYSGQAINPTEGSTRAAALGYQLDVYDLAEYDNPMRLGDVLYARGVRGILLGQLYGQPSLPELGWKRFACVCLSRPFFPVPFDVVRARILETMVAAFEKVRARGYRRLGFDVQIHHSWGADHPDDKARYAAALYCQQQLPRRERLPIHRGRVSESAGFKEWVVRCEPDAVISSSADRMLAMREVGLKVPEEVGFLALQLSVPSPLKASGFVSSLTGESAKAVEILDHHIRHNLIGPRPDPMEHLVFKPWHEGSSLPEKQR